MHVLPQGPEADGEAEGDDIIDGGCGKRAPQSAQSEPMGHVENSEPGPPSSQSPSDA